ncbi:unnamed protein product, partial [marine sediment metagenome]
TTRLRETIDSLEERVTERTAEVEEGAQDLLRANAQLEGEVTERKRAEEEIKAQKNFTDNVIDSLPDTFYIFDPESGKGIQWNKTLNEISGYKYEEMSEYPPLHFYPPEEHQLIEEVVKTTLEKGRATVELNYIIADGTRIPFEYSTVLIKNAEGKPCICAIGRDITERKRAEGALERANAELELRVGERTAELAAANEQLQRDITERKRVEEEREKALYNMGERMKELACMYRVTNAGQTRQTMEELLQ